MAIGCRLTKLQLEYLKAIGLTPAFSPTLEKTGQKIPRGFAG